MLTDLERELLEVCRISGVVEVLDRIGNHAAARLFEKAIRRAEAREAAEAKQKE